MEISLELLRHLVTNDHGELTTLFILASENWPWLRVVTSRWRSK